METVELRKAEDLEQDFDGLVLPGGESTVQSRLLKELSMFETLKKKIEEGLPVLATCAGLILLAQNISNDEIDALLHYGYCKEKCIRKAAWKLLL